LPIHFGIFTDTGWLFGIILAVIVGAVIIGGIKSIAKVTEKIVPLMAIYMWVPPW
jgi:AGCS family alanine or glycine:cation symporter